MYCSSKLAVRKRIEAACCSQDSGYRKLPTATVVAVVTSTQTHTTDTQLCSDLQQ